MNLIQLPKLFTNGIYKNRVIVHQICDHTYHMKLRFNKGVLDVPMYDSLRYVTDRLNESDCKAIIVESHQSFCPSITQPNLAQEIADDWKNLPAMMLSTVHGRAYGDGLRLLMGTDFRIAHSRARLSVHESGGRHVPNVDTKHMKRANHSMDFIAGVSDNPLQYALDAATYFSTCPHEHVRLVKRKLQKSR